MSTTFRVLLYLRIDSNLYLVDTIYGDDKDELLSTVRDRKLGNSEYIAVLLSYQLVSANIVNVELNNEEEAVST